MKRLIYSLGPLLMFFCCVALAQQTEQQQPKQNIAVINLKDGSTIKGFLVSCDNENITVQTDVTETKVKITAIRSITFGEQLDELPFRIDPQGKAIVIVYREPFEKTLGKFTLPVRMDDYRLAQLDTTRYFVARVEPGKHLWNSTDKNVKPLELMMNAGQLYILKMDVRRGMLSVSGRITLVPNEIGITTIKQLRPIDKEDIKDTKFVISEISEK